MIIANMKAPPTHHVYQHVQQFSEITIQHLKENPLLKQLKLNQEHVCILLAWYQLRHWTILQHVSQSFSITMLQDDQRPKILTEYLLPFIMNILYLDQNWHCASDCCHFNSNLSLIYGIITSLHTTC